MLWTKANHERHSHVTQSECAAECRGLIVPLPSRRSIGYLSANWNNQRFAGEEMTTLECQKWQLSRERARAWLSFQKEIFWQGLILVTLFSFCCKKKGCSWGRRLWQQRIQIAEALLRAAASCKTWDGGPHCCLHAHGPRRGSRKYLARETTNRHLCTCSSPRPRRVCRRTGSVGGGSSGNPSFIFFAVSSFWVPGSHLPALRCCSGEGRERGAVLSVIVSVWLV